MKKSLAVLAAVLLAGTGATVLAQPASAAVCNDGWVSSSSGRGTCSWHGGISGGSRGDSWGSNSYGRNGSGRYGNNYGSRGNNYNNFGSNNYGYDPYGQRW